MRSMQFLKNLAKHALLLSLVVFFLILNGCSRQPDKAYYNRSNITQAIEEKCKNEYSLEVKAKLVGDTIWVYVPIEDFFQQSEKPTKYTEKFQIDQLEDKFNGKDIAIDYSIKPIPEAEKTQDLGYNKEIIKAINHVTEVLFRVIASFDRKKEAEPKFLGIIIADIKNGYEIVQISENMDFKKALYGLIPHEEYQHRMIQITNLDDAIISDKEGKHYNFIDMKMRDFINQQILQRIRLRFQKPEVEKNADIDEEITKIASYTLKLYNFKDFDELELNNILTGKQVILNREAVWKKAND